MRRFLLVIPLFAVLVLASCSSGVSSGFIIFLDGKWVGKLLSQHATPLPFSGDVTMNISQEEGSTVLSGVVIISDPETGCWIGGTIDPTASFVNGSKVRIVIEDGTGATITIDGDATTSTIIAIYTSTGHGDTGDGGGGEEPAPEEEPQAAGCVDHSGTFSATITS